MQDDRRDSGPHLIGPHGGYAKLGSYQVATIVYDATVAFCDRFISPRSRTHDQMVQAARSAKQNIPEGSVRAATSRMGEFNLTGVALASAEELLKDYEDFLRQRGLPLWEKERPPAQAVRRLAYAPNRSYETYRARVERGTPEVAANTLVCLVNQGIYLVRRQLRALEARLLEEGGVRENFYRARREMRDQERPRGR